MQFKMNKFVKIIFSILLIYVCLISGFKVPYKPEDIETDVEELGEKLSARFTEFCKEYGRELTLMFEPGKFLVSEAGFLFAKCTLVKQTTSTSFVGVDTGLNHLIRPMFYGSYHKIINVTEPPPRSASGTNVVSRGEETKTLKKFLGHLVDEVGLPQQSCQSS